MNYQTLLAVLVLVCSVNVFAEGVPMTPGKWEMTMTMEMSMLPAPQVKTHTECIEESELDPDTFKMDANSPCDLSDVEIDGNTMRWSISCPGPAGDMKGDWEFTSEGDSVTGTGAMRGDMGGIALEMNMTWEGTRLGDCD